MSTLYISDLDGTLFNKEKKISDKSIRLLNQCIDNGMKFAVATARMPYGCDYRLKELHLNIPGILTNGVFLYDFQTKKYISVEAIKKESAEQVVRVMETAGLSCFVYIYRKENIYIYYGKKELEEQTQYYSGRALEECAAVSFVSDLPKALENGEVFYLTYSGEKELLEPVCDALEAIAGINYSFYLNIYNSLYCLEIYSSRASKQAALLKLKNYVKCDEVVVFGDNWNDVPMIEIADRSYAPENALEEIKEMVTAVIPGCNDDGVARFLSADWEKK